MDPATALGLASNVLGVIDFTANFVIEVTKFLKSTSDALPENEWFERLAKQNQALSQEIDAAARNQQLNKLDREICELAIRCNAESQNLINVLSPLKVAVKNGVKSKRDVVWKAFKSKLLKSDEIQASQAKLERLELQLSTLLLQSIRNSQEEGFASITKLIDSRGDDAVSAMRSSRDEILQLLSASHQETVTRVKKTEETTSRLEALLIDAEERERVGRVLANLYFAEMNNRVDAIDERHRNSFDWIFMDGPLSATNASFKTWLTSEESTFWVCGEPGSGKSVLMKMLRRHVKTAEYLKAWAGGDAFVVCEFYFWIAGGASLQKSATGFLRTIVHQALSRYPGLLADPLLRGLLFHTGPQGRAWTTEILVNAIVAIAAQVKLCMFVDGLDECDGGPQKIQCLVQSLGGLTKLANVKMCVSSRPWPIFEAAYGSLASRILLQELTEDDIFRFTTETLVAADPVSFSQELCGDVSSYSYRRWDRFVRGQRAGVSTQARHVRQLIDHIVWKANGSFLWTALILDSICTRLEGGEPLELLESRVEAVPQKLESYYETSILDRISETYRSPGCSETAMALRLAMVNADISGDAVGVAEMSLYRFWLVRKRLQHGGLPSRSLSMAAPLPFKDHADAEWTTIVDQAQRYLSGCCRGLLHVAPVSSDRSAPSAQSANDSDSDSGSDFDVAELETSVSWPGGKHLVDFKHRTILDFLRSDRGQKLLEEGLPEQFEEALDEIFLEAAVALHKRRPPHKCVDLYRLGRSMVKLVAPKLSRRSFWDSAMVRCTIDFCPEARCLSSPGAHDVLVDIARLEMLQTLNTTLQKRPSLVAIAASPVVGYESSLLTHLVGMRPQYSEDSTCTSIPLQAVELVLSYGADPNARSAPTKNDNTLFRSIWHTWLACLAGANSENAASNDTNAWVYQEAALYDDDSQADVDGWMSHRVLDLPQRVGLVKLFIRYGADLGSNVCTAHGDCQSVAYSDYERDGPDLRGPAVKRQPKPAGEYMAFAASVNHEDRAPDAQIDENAEEILQSDADNRSIQTALTEQPSSNSEHPPPATDDTGSNPGGATIEVQEGGPALQGEPSHLERWIAAQEHCARGRRALARFYIDDMHIHAWKSVREIVSDIIADEDLHEVLALMEEYSTPHKVHAVETARLDKIRGYDSADLALDDIIALQRPQSDCLRAVDVKNDEQRLRMLLDIEYHGEWFSRNRVTWQS